MKTFLKYTLLVVLAACLMPQNADAQLLKKLKERAERRAQQKIESRANRAVDNAVDGAEDAIEGAIVGEAPDEGGGQAATKKPGTRAWANYDFVPGHRVLAYHDFQTTYVGNFPNHLTYMTGNMEAHPWKRSLGVVQMIINVASPGSFNDDGRAIITSQKMRLLHAGIRAMVPKYVPDYVENYGLD